MYTNSIDTRFVFVGCFSPFFTGLPALNLFILLPVIFLSNKLDHFTCLLKNFCWFTVE